MSWRDQSDLDECQTSMVKGFVKRKSTMLRKAHSRAKRAFLSTGDAVLIVMRLPKRPPISSSIAYQKSALPRAEVAR